MSRNIFFEKRNAKYTVNLYTVWSVHRIMQIRRFIVVVVYDIYGQQATRKKAIDTKGRYYTCSIYTATFGITQYVRPPKAPARVVSNEFPT